jgi:hypothetical protein
LQYSQNLERKGKGKREKAKGGNRGEMEGGREFSKKYQ